MSVILVVTGFVGKDPETRFTASGQQVTNFSIASTRSWKDASGTKVKETTWFRVSAWGKLAEICASYVKKGKQVQVQGRLVVDLATGGPKTFARADGTTGAAFEMSVNEMELLGKASDDGAEAEAGSDSTEDEIPF
jgi:single-strand DNA-binding protein